MYILQLLLNNFNHYITTIATSEVYVSNTTLRTSHPNCCYIKSQCLFCTSNKNLSCFMEVIWLMKEWQKLLLCRTPQITCPANVCSVLQWVEKMWPFSTCPLYPATFSSFRYSRTCQNSI